MQCDIIQPNMQTNNQPATTVHLLTQAEFNNTFGNIPSPFEALNPFDGTIIIFKVIKL